MFTETIQIKQKREYFAIKNGILYSYAYERAREAKKMIPLKETKGIQRDEKNSKEFYIIYKKKCYKLAADSENECLKWVNSLKYVLSNSDDNTDLNRYEK